MHTNGHTISPDEAIDSLYAFWPGTAPAPAPCPEAAFSLTLKGHLDGIEALFTIRGQSAREFQANLAAVRGLLDAPAAPRAPAQPATQPPQEPGWCAKHGMEMQRNQKEGRSWWSHRLSDGSWCKGK